MHMFQHLSNLQRLLLDDNLIEFVEAASFSHLTSLTQLTLNDNFLTTLGETIFNVNNPPSTLHDFRIYNNFLVCDNKMSWIMAADGDWLTLTSPELIHCSTTHFHVTCSKYFLLQTTWSTLDVFKLVTHESVLYCVVPFMSMLTLISTLIFKVNEP